MRPRLAVGELLGLLRNGSLFSSQAPRRVPRRRAGQGQGGPQGPRRVPGRARARCRAPPRHRGLLRREGPGRSGRQGTQEDLLRDVREREATLGRAQDARARPGHRRGRRRGPARARGERVGRPRGRLLEARRRLPERREARRGGGGGERSRAIGRRTPSAFSSAFRQAASSRPWIPSTPSSPTAGATPSRSSPR